MSHFADLIIVEQQFFSLNELKIELEFILNKGGDEDKFVFFDGLIKDVSDAEIQKVVLLGYIRELPGESFNFSFYGETVVNLQILSEKIVEVKILGLVLHSIIDTLSQISNIKLNYLQIQNQKQIKKYQHFLTEHRKNRRKIGKMKGPIQLLIIGRYNSQYSKMGQQSSGIIHINQISQSLTLVRQLPGEKIYINRATDEQYLLITRLAQGHDEFQNLLAKRKELKCSYLPQLVDYGKETQGYCSDIVVMNILFRHPAKCLSEEQIHRNSVGEWFQEGQMLMISYCALIALQEYCKMGENYELNVNEQTLLIEMDGKIILTDTPRYKDQSSRRQSLRRICSEQGKIMSRIAMMQLGVVLFRMIQDDTTKQSYSQSLRHFVQSLRTGGFQSYEEALIHLEYIKRTDKSGSTKLPKSQASLDQTPSILPIPTTHSTPIGQLIHLIETREPLKELNDSHQNQQSGIKSFCYLTSKKKESKYHIYKSKFQARKAEAFAEECVEHIAEQQESTIIRLDEISSIQRQTFRETEEDEQETPIDNNNILPEGLMCYQSQQTFNHPPVARIELFNSNQPQRLKQLVLNQKGIIYEQSADELSSLASQRTHRIRNFSFYND